MSKSKFSLSVPSDTGFLSNKNISDRVYVWILLNGEYMGDTICIDRKPRGAYKEIGIDYKTFYKRLQDLVDNNYLEYTEFGYQTNPESSAYNRLVYKSTLETLYNAKIDNIIKVYVYLSSLYSSYNKGAYFTYDKLARELGYDTEGNNRYKIRKKIVVILDKLEELGLIKYEKYSKSSIYNYKFRITGIKK